MGISVAESETAANHIRRSSAKFLVLASKGTWSGNAQNLTHQFVVNEAGKEYLVTNNPTEVVYSVVLRCNGSVCGNIDGASGSNCQKRPLQRGWCSEFGKCSPECTFVGKHTRECPEQPIKKIVIPLVKILCD